MQPQLNVEKLGFNSDVTRLELHISKLTSVFVKLLKRCIEFILSIKLRIKTFF